jgi:hypothetical protein
MGGLEPTPAPSVAQSERSVSLGSTYDPGAGSNGASNGTVVRTDANGNTVMVITGPTPQPASTGNGTAPYGTTAGAPAGTVNGNYGPLPATGLGVTAAPPNAGVNTH